jgi:hypothetical protein
MTDKIAEAAAAATEKLARMTEEYRNSPEQVAARERAELERLRNDPNFLGRPGAARDEQAMQTRIAALERTAEQTEKQRIDAILRGENVAGPETTVADQVPRKDLANAMVDLVERGVRPELLNTYLETGHSDLDQKDRPAEIAAAEKWEKDLMRNPEKQRKLLDGDPQILKELAAFAIYKKRLGE